MVFVSYEQNYNKNEMDETSFIYDCEQISKELKL